MDEMKFHVKNMVCRRCVMAVEDICRELGLGDARVELGCVTLAVRPAEATMSLLCERLRQVGFEPLKSHEMVLVEKIKAAIRYYARHYNADGSGKLSTFLSESTGLDSRHVSRLFSSLEGRTVQGYLMSQRLEYVKEMLQDGELTLVAIADNAGFSSVAHLSRAFKKSQGMTLSEFRATGHRSPIDEI